MREDGREESDLFSRERLALGTLQPFEDGRGVSRRNHVGDRLRDRVLARRVDARDEVGVTLLERRRDGLVVRRVDFGRDDAVDDREARLAVERRVGSGEAADTVVLGETTAEAPVEVAAKERRENGVRTFDAESVHSRGAT